jgi:predicted phosphoribosyltransferase
MQYGRGFRDRVEAGEALAVELERYAGRADVVVLGLPRGGVPVAAKVATALGAPLDVIVVRKVGVPGHHETAMGAVGPNGVSVLDRGLIDHLDVDRRLVAVAVERAQREMNRREAAYRSGRPAPAVRGRIVILVDDGLATGATMVAAVKAIRAQTPTRVVVAVPVGSTDALRLLSRVADEIVCVVAPEPFVAVGYWYSDFSATTDDEVIRLLADAARPCRATG